MAGTLYFQLNETASLNDLVDYVAKRLQMKGYLVRVYPSANGITTLSAEKDTGGLSFIVGYQKSIKVHFIKNAGNLTVSFSDEAWVDKIVGFFVGWLLCWIPWIFVGIGLYNQFQLPKEIEHEIITYTGMGPAPFATNYAPPSGSWTKKCEGCGSSIGSSEAFCKHCGKKQ